MSKIRKIKERCIPGTKNLIMSGWFNGKHTYLHFSSEHSLLGYYDGQGLYRLAKAIVKQFEEPAVRGKK